MGLLSASEIAGFEATQVSAMQDVVNLENATESGDSFGDPVRGSETVTTGVLVGFSFEAGSVEDQNSHENINYDATMRCARTVAILMTTQVRLTNLKGKAMDVTFEPVKMPEMGVSAQNVLLRLVKH